MGLCDWDKVELGRTGLTVSRLGIGSSYGVSGTDLERAFERGVNYFYWGSSRRPDFGRGLSAIAKKDRDHAVFVVQSYTRIAALMRPSLESALRRLGVDYVDLLLLGMWNTPPSARIVDAARKLVDAGKARHILISCHHRPTFATYIPDPTYGAIMLRYNAAHRGAEREVFPLLGADRPGVVGYTATRWAALLDSNNMPAGEKTPTARDCYRFVLSRPEVDVCIAGARNGVDLDDAMHGLDLGPMSADELAWMERVGDHVHAHQPRSTQVTALGVLDRLTGG